VIEKSDLKDKFDKSFLATNNLQTLFQKLINYRVTFQDLGFHFDKNKSKPSYRFKINKKTPGN
jgi:hypothetical protein